MSSVLLTTRFITHTVISKGDIINLEKILMVKTNEKLEESFAALFNDPNNAEQAYNLDLQKGYNKEDINVFMWEEIKKKLWHPNRRRFYNKSYFNGKCRSKRVI